MLSLLRIENIAVIEQAEIMFNKGFNVFTGETGAGKSIVIDAISAVLGERTYRDLIRTGCQKASVAAVFHGIAELPWFAEKQVPYDAEELHIQREIHADGRNICRVNSVPVSVGTLRELGKNLINIHGQNETQTLFDEQTHLQYLDISSDYATLMQDYSVAYDTYVQAYQEVKRLSMSESERLRKIEMLEYQLSEIERAQLTAGEDEELLSKRRVLQNAEKLSASLQSALCCLDGDDSMDGAVALLSNAQRSLNKIANIDAQYASFTETAGELMYAAQDLCEEIRSQLEDLSYSGGALEEIESRLDIIGRLQKKYGKTVSDILQYAENAREELDSIADADTRLEFLRAALAEKEAAARNLALSLRERRKAAAIVLQQRIEDELSQLDMPNIQFCVEFEETDLGAQGMDFVRFLMSANAGESLKPISKVASGGELARIMLAMKNVLSEKDNIPTLIFDEVDSGISGRAAQKVAKKLLSVSRGKQVFSVTHLPQIAAIADTHLLISKSVQQGRTYTTVKQLSKNERIEEISRIIGGNSITDTTRKNAEEMLNDR